MREGRDSRIEALYQGDKLAGLGQDEGELSSPRNVGLGILARASVHRGFHHHGERRHGGGKKGVGSWWGWEQEEDGERGREKGQQGLAGAKSKPDQQQAELRTEPPGKRRQP